VIAKAAGWMESAHEDVMREVEAGDYISAKISDGLTIGAN